MRPLLQSGIALALVACGAGDPAPPPAVEFSGPPSSAQPNLARTPDGAAVLTWHEQVTGKRYALRFAVRDAGGWTAPRTVVESDSFFVNWADFPSLVALGDGTWLVHWLARAPGSKYAYHVRLAVSRDRGTTWSQPITAHRDRSPQEHGFVAMVPWDDSTAALVWLDGREMTASDTSHESEGDMTLRFTTVTSSGRLGPERMLDARTCECCQTALARTADGLIVAYRDRSPEEIRDIAVVRLVHGSWTTPIKVGADNWHYPGCPVNGPALAASGDTVAIAWFTAPEGQARVFAGFSFDGGASWEAPLRIDDGHPEGRVDIELWSGDSAVITWLESANDRSEIRARRVTPRGPGERSWHVAKSSEARSSGFPRTLRFGKQLLFAWTSADGIRVAVQELDD